MSLLDLPRQQWMKTAVFSGKGPIVTGDKVRRYKERLFLEALCGDGLVVVTQGFVFSDRNWHVYIYDITERTVLYAGEAGTRKAAFSKMIIAAGEDSEREMLGGFPPVYRCRKVISNEVDTIPICVGLDLWREPKPPRRRTFDWRKRYEAGAPLRAKCPRCKSPETRETGYGSVTIIEVHTSEGCPYAVHICRKCKENIQNTFFLTPIPRQENDKSTPELEAIVLPLTEPGNTKNSHTPV